MTYRIEKLLSNELKDFMKVKYQSSFVTDIYLKSRYLDNQVALQYFCVYDTQNSLQDVLVFYIKKKAVVVANWLVDISDELASFFQKSIFSEHPEIDRIVWEMTQNAINVKNSFSYVNNYDMCIMLPGSVDEYNKMLSSNSRKLYVKKTHRVERDMEKIVIDETATADNLYMIDRLDDWKRSQLAKRGEKSKMSVSLLKNVALKFGSISYIIADGDVACVCLFYKIGTHIYYEQTAYDEKYAYYSLGRVAVYQSILHFIQQGFTHFHFLWKGADYKKHYCAKELPLYETVTYKRKGFSYCYDYTKRMMRLKIRHAMHTKYGQSLRKFIRKLKK
ncbi:MAG: GNAT family N-acetyltransferase [Muribaculaceae bacterium]|nr:GNAT family N-acetyltransferase [Muribaculaceae bacterium]